MESTSESASFSSSDPILGSSGSLRFPILTTDERITICAQSISRKRMTSESENSSDFGILGESAYELIDTDEENHDDNETESVVSSDNGHPDDFNSPVSAECSGEDSCEEDSLDSCHSTFPDKISEKSVDPPAINHKFDGFADKIERLLFPSIEFDESLNEDGGNIRVKHTVGELNENQSSKALEHIYAENPRKRVMLSVRQTMTKLDLSTNVPLRILYFGSLSANQDIIHKIASSIIASVDDHSRDPQRCCSGFQHYDIITNSAFGSGKSSGIELMHPSRYHIKVDNCYSAQSVKCTHNSGKPDVIKLVLDDQYACYSVPSGNDCFDIDPCWELPHVAIIYISNIDDVIARNEITIIGEFLNRHSIPSIVISKELLLDYNHSPSLDQHSIHMCLESRDPNGGEALMHKRLPIDLTSFMNIDARQLNRNLAYVTGLHEPLNSSIGVKLNLINQVSNKRNFFSGKIALSSLGQGPYMSRFIFFFKRFLLGFFFILMIVITSYNTFYGPIISVNNKLISTTSKLPVMASYGSLSPKILATSFQCTLLKSTADNVSNASKMFYSTYKTSRSLLGKSSKWQNSLENQPISKCLACTAEIYGEHEILIRISSHTGLSTSKSDAISLSIMRNKITINTNRVYSSKTVIALVLPKEEAYGIVNVSIKTVKIPRPNLECTLDFGLSAFHFWQVFKDKVSSITSHDSKIDGNDIFFLRKAASAANHLFARSRKKLPTFIEKMRDTCYKAGDNFSLVSRFLDGKFVRGICQKAIRKSTLVSKLVGTQSGKLTKMLNILVRPLDIYIFKARVESKMLWLRLRGMKKEERQYLKKAVAATKRLYSEENRNNYYH